MTGPTVSGSPRCVAVVDDALPPGLAANAVGVLALTLGATVDASRDPTSSTPTASTTRG